MRLLDTSSIEFHEFFGIDIPVYAILSHRWEPGEVSFQDVRDRKNLEAPGWSKIRKCCELAKADGRRWVWIDTCCIDKISSSELSEAINSMFYWYQDSKTCYAYLSDVSSGLVEREDTEEMLRKSEWFTRGWTLQELLAPRNVVFVSSDWKTDIGTKRDLAELLSEITGIKDIWGLDISEVSVAARMSWAERRKCTRQEDIAYCLMGLFGVNMPLLYGEGDAAFRRLQLEILKDSDDESLFAWYLPRPRGMFFGEGRSKKWEGMLAQTPDDFKDSGDVRVRTGNIIARGPYAMTNKGLQFDATLYPVDGKIGFFHLPLNCTIPGTDDPLAITLKAPDEEFPFWTRTYCEKLFVLYMGLKSEREHRFPRELIREDKIFIRGRNELPLKRRMAGERLARSVRNAVTK